MTTHEKPMTRDQWIAAYASRIERAAGWNADAARDAAEVGAIEYENNERAAHNAIVWEHPEDAADEEMSYWTDDGEG